VPSARVGSQVWGEKLSFCLEVLKNNYNSLTEKRGGKLVLVKGGNYLVKSTERGQKENLQTWGNMTVGPLSELEGALWAGATGGW